MDRRPPGRHTSRPVKAPAGELSPEDELRLALGRAIGFTVAALVLLLGGGIALIVLGGLFFQFLFGP